MQHCDDATYIDTPSPLRYVLALLCKVKVIARAEYPLVSLVEYQ